MMLIRQAKGLAKRFCGNVLLRSCPVNEKQALFYITRYHSDNCLALLDYLIKTEEPDFRFRLLVEMPQFEYYRSLYQEEPRVSVVCMRKSMTDAARAIVSSRYIFYMHHGDPLHGIRRRPGQRIINCWHGSGYKAPPSAQYGARYAAPEAFDAVLVPGPVFVETKADYFHCPKEKVLPLGYPRYDQLIHVPEDRKKTAGKLWAGDGKTVKVLWAPTYRQTLENCSFGEEKIHTGYDLPLLHGDEELRNLDERCEKQGISLLIKRHPHQIRYHGEDLAGLRAVRFVDNETLQEQGISLAELMAASDGLISDYSSISVDYLLLDRPIAFLLEDFDQYAEGRGFVFRNPLDYMPGNHVRSMDDLLMFLDDLANGLDRFRDERTRVLPEMHNVCDHYCKCVWEHVREGFGTESAADSR